MITDDETKIHFRCLYCARAISQETREPDARCLFKPTPTTDSHPRTAPSDKRVTMSSASTPSSFSNITYSGNSTPCHIDYFENPRHEFTHSLTAASMPSTEELLICSACGTQFDVEDRKLLKTCRICDDPRQFVPRTGQAFTTLGELKRDGYRNQWEVLDGDERFWSIWTEPKFAIGQRAVLIRTPTGNVLWDCVSFIDEETVKWINGLGGLAAIVISHPHYYSTVSGRFFPSFSPYCYLPVEHYY